MQKFSGESYRHAAARHVFAQWLRNESTYDNYRGVFGLTWRADIPGWAVHRLGQ